MLAFMSMEGKRKESAEFLTVDEAARLVGLSHWTVRNYVRRARLTKYRSGNRTLVSRVELLELLKPVKVRPAKPSARQGAATRIAAPTPPKEQTK